MTLKSIPFDLVQQTYGVKENVQPCGAFRNRPLRAHTDPFWDEEIAYIFKARSLCSTVLERNDDSIVSRHTCTRLEARH